jgi:hypothetical protein
MTGKSAGYQCGAGLRPVELWSCDSRHDVNVRHRNSTVEIGTQYMSLSALRFSLAKKVQATFRLTPDLHRYVCVVKTHELDGR